MLWRDLGRASAFVRRQDVSVVISHLPPSHFFARLLFLAMILRGRRLRLIQYHHSLERRLNPRDTFAKRAFFAIDEILARLSDHAHWHISEQVRQDVTCGFTRRDAIIHNSCDMTSPGDPDGADRLLAPTQGQDSPYVILVPGSLRSMKGHVLFLHALAHLCRTENLGPAELQVAFVGEGDQRQTIEKTIDELALGDHVSLTGKTTHSVLLAIYRKVDLVVVPSLEEGFGNVAIEAISRGALVLASDAGGLRVILRHGENGFVFAASDEEALVAELTNIWRDRRSPLIDHDAARLDCAARFSMKAHIDRILALLKV